MLTKSVHSQLNNNNILVKVVVRLLSLLLAFSVVVSCGDDSDSSAPTAVAEKPVSQKPGAPTSVIANVSGNSISLSWAIPANPGTNAEGKTASIISYELEYSNADGNWIPLSTSGKGIRLSNSIGNNTSAVIIGVTSGSTYFFRVIAINEVGKGLTSVVKSVLFQNNPDMVSSITVSPDTVNLFVTSNAVLTFSFSPATATNTNVTWTSSDAGVATVSGNGDATATVTAVSVGTATITAAAGGLSASVTVTVTEEAKDLARIIANGKIPADLSTYDQSAQDIFSGYPADATVITRYVAAGGTGNKSGTNWANAADNLKTVLDGITDNSATKVYAVLLGPGEYKAGAEMSMKNYVTIAGGITTFNTVPDNAAAIGSTILSGNNSHRVFNHDNNDINPLASTARLYGVTIANGKHYVGGGMYNSDRSSPTLARVVFSGNTAGAGGGMYNIHSSPILTRVVFSGNTATEGGGGIYNYSSTPILTGVVFSGNTATKGGGGIYNYSSTPILTGVVFSGNTASNGGGIYNESSSPILTKVILSGNKGASNGGGIYNKYSSPILTGVVFSGNTATKGEGGMYNSDHSSPTAVNTIFWGQDVSGGTDFYYSVVQGGNSASPFNNVTTDPGILPLADNGGGIQTMAIPSTSSARDKGIYVRRKDSTHYYSIDKSTWYDTPALSGTATLPNDAIDLTAFDMRGEPVNGRPDIGVYEAR